MKKMSLAMDMDKVTMNYQKSLNAKVLKWTNNNGATYIDLSYANLMRPGATNNNKPYMITDAAGKVVVDGTYKQYAEMISPDGAPGGDYESNRSAILADLIGMNATDIDNAETYYNTYLQKKDYLERIDNAEPDKTGFEIKDPHSVKKLLQKLGNSGGISDWVSAYNNSGQTISGSQIPSTINAIKEKLGPYFMNDQSRFEAACDSAANLVDQTNDITVQALIDKLMGYYQGKGGAFVGGAYSDPSTGNPTPVWYDVDKPEYQTYVQNHSEWQAQRDTAEQEMKTALDGYNNLFNADVQMKMKFYDELFQTIADKGWVCNDRVSDTDYLNQMLQNNMYYITTMQQGKDTDGNPAMTYSTDIALNCPKITQVSDSTTRDDALVKYEAEKRTIQNKEDVIDVKMKKLETEDSAIQQMMESIKNTIKENSDRTMNIFA
jgi:hypothetical protein